MTTRTIIQCSSAAPPGAAAAARARDARIIITSACATGPLTEETHAASLASHSAVRPPAPSATAATPRRSRATIVVCSRTAVAAVAPSAPAARAIIAARPSRAVVAPFAPRAAAVAHHHQAAEASTVPIQNASLLASRGVHQHCSVQLARDLRVAAIGAAPIIPNARRAPGTHLDKAAHNKQQKSRTERREGKEENGEEDEEEKGEE